MSEIINLANGGLVLVAIAWLIQLIQILRGFKNINPVFILLYIIGVSTLAYGIYLQTNTVSYFELSTIIMAAIVFIAVLGKKN